MGDAPNYTHNLHEPASRAFLALLFSSVSLPLGRRARRKTAYSTCLNVFFPWLVRAIGAGLDPVAAAEFTASVIAGSGVLCMILPAPFDSFPSFPGSRALVLPPSRKMNDVLP